MFALDGSCLPSSCTSCLCSASSPRLGSWGQGDARACVSQLIPSGSPQSGPLHSVPLPPGSRHLRPPGSLPAQWDSCPCAFLSSPRLGAFDGISQETQGWGLLHLPEGVVPASSGRAFHSPGIWTGIWVLVLPGLQ